VPFVAWRLGRGDQVEFPSAFFCEKAVNRCGHSPVTPISDRYCRATSDSGPAGTVMLPAAKAKILTSAVGNFTSRALFPFDPERHVEFYKLTLAPRSREIADPHPPGTPKI
jgi:hypothetical protein